MSLHHSSLSPTNNISPEELTHNSLYSYLEGVKLIQAIRNQYLFADNDNRDQSFYSLINSTILDSRCAILKHIWMIPQLWDQPFCSEGYSRI